MNTRGWLPVLGGMFALAIGCSPAGKRTDGAGGAGPGGNGGSGAGGGVAGSGGQGGDGVDAAGGTGAGPGSGGRDAGSMGGIGGSGAGGAGGGSTTPDASRPDGNNCIENFDLQKGPPPNVVIVLDKSGSMTQVPATGTGNLWAQTTAAIRGAVMATQSEIKWGISFFPSDGSCAVAPVEVPVAPDNYAAIDGAIRTKGPNGGTPTRAAMNEAITYLDTVVDPGRKYILLATDGRPNCDGKCPAPYYAKGNSCCTKSCPNCGESCGGAEIDDSDGSVAVTTTAAMKGYHTFVVGLATTDMFFNTLERLAEAGLEARMGSPKFYAVTDRAGLEMAMRTIAARIISCEFKLAKPPADPGRTQISIPGPPVQSVPFDATRMNGWAYGPENKTVIFYGSWCERVQQGEINDVTAYFGCGTA